MKNKSLKKVIRSRMGVLKKSIEISILNEAEAGYAVGGISAGDCPRLNKNACNPYSECGVKVELKRRGKSNKKAN